MSLSGNRGMTDHKLDVVRSVDGMENVLVKNLQCAAAQEALFPGGGIYAGRCVSRDPVSGVASLGCTGRKVPYFLFRSSNLPSTGAYSDPTPVEDAVGLVWKDGINKAVLAYASIEGIELATTEYDAAAAAGYNLGTLLRAPDAAEVGPADADILAGAGVLTSDGCVYGAVSIVGVVSDPPVSPHKVSMLKFYGLYRPPIEGLADGFAEPTWAP